MVLASINSDVVFCVFPSRTSRRCSVWPPPEPPPNRLAAFWDLLLRQPSSPKHPTMKGVGSSGPAPSQLPDQTADAAAGSLRAYHLLQLRYRLSNSLLMFCLFNFSLTYCRIWRRKKTFLIMPAIKRCRYLRCIQPMPCILLRF